MEHHRDHWNWGVDVRYCYPKVRYWSEKDQEWKVRSKRIVVRRLWLQAPPNGFGPPWYRVVRTERRGAVSYSVCSLEVPKPPLWQELKLRPEPDRRRWVRVGSMNEREIAAWLKPYMGDSTAAALDALAYAEPE